MTSTGLRSANRVITNPHPWRRATSSMVADLPTPGGPHSMGGSPARRQSSTASMTSSIHTALGKRGSTPRPGALPPFLPVFSNQPGPPQPRPGSQLSSTRRPRVGTYGSTPARGRGTTPMYAGRAARLLLPKVSGQRTGGNGVPGRPGRGKDCRLPPVPSAAQAVPGVKPGGTRATRRVPKTPGPGTGPPSHPFSLPGRSSAGPRATAASLRPA